MSNPIIVDTVENSFIPLLIYNNKSVDSALLKKFGEPTWNYQVIRFLNSDGKDLIPRRDKIWTTTALVPRMIKALERSKQPIPSALKLLQQETSTHNHANAAFSQYCFWTGEMRLGAIDGVILTEAGWIAGREVTFVTYDKTKLSLASLVKQASKAKCADQAYVPAAQLAEARKVTTKTVHPLTKSYYKAKSSDQKRQIAGTSYSKLQLTPAQATKVNAFARTNQTKALSFLTQGQLNSL